MWQIYSGPSSPCRSSEQTCSMGRVCGIGACRPLGVALVLRTPHAHYHPAVYAICAVYDVSEYDGPFLFYANIFL